MNPAYFDTVFDLYSQQDLPEDFVIITAYNPQGRSAPPSRNQHQDQTLRAVLEGRGATPFRVTGRSEDGRHQEPGWGAALDLQTGLEIGRIFKQEAIYHVSGDELCLCDCTQTRVERLGSWNARIKTRSTS